MRESAGGGEGGELSLGGLVVAAVAAGSGWGSPGRGGTPVKALLQDSPVLASSL